MFNYYGHWTPEQIRKENEAIDTLFARSMGLNKWSIVGDPFGNKAASWKRGIWANG